MTVVMLLWFFNIGVFVFVFRKFGISRIWDDDVLLSFSNFLRRLASASSRSFSGCFDTGAETVNIADDNAVDNADDVPKLLYNFAVNADEEEELLEDNIGPEEAELLVAPLDEL